MKKIALFFILMIRFAFSQQEVKNSENRFYIEPTFALEEYKYWDYGYFGSKSPEYLHIKQERVNLSLNLHYRNRFFILGLGTSYLILNADEYYTSRRLIFFNDIYLRSSFNCFAWKENMKDYRFGPYVTVGSIINNQNMNLSFGFETYLQNVKIWAGYGVFEHKNYPGLDNSMKSNNIVSFGFGYAFPIRKPKVNTADD